MEREGRDSGGFENEENDEFEEAQEHVERPPQLPSDLPRSLDDRKNFQSYNDDTEYYDAWQGVLMTKNRLMRAD